MLSKETIVNVFLKCSEATTGHVRLTDCLYLLEAMLLAQGVKSVIDTVEELNQLPTRILLHCSIEAPNISVDDCDFTLRFREILFTVLSP